MSPEGLHSSLTSSDIQVSRHNQVFLPSKIYMQTPFFLKSSQSPELYFQHSYLVQVLIRKGKTFHRRDYRSRADERRDARDVVVDGGTTADAVRKTWRVAERFHCGRVAVFRRAEAAV